MRVVAVERDDLVTHLRRARSRLGARARGEVAIARRERADALVDDVLVVEALRGGVLVRVGGGVERCRGAR